jgi:hypothetical protein
MRAGAFLLPLAAADRAIGDPPSMPPVVSCPAEAGAHPTAPAERHARNDHDPALARPTPGPRRASSQTMPNRTTEAGPASSTRDSGDRARVNLIMQRADP